MTNCELSIIPVARGNCMYKNSSGFASDGRRWRLSLGTACTQAVAKKTLGINVLEFHDL